MKKADPTKAKSSGRPGKQISAKTADALLRSLERKRSDSDGTGIKKTGVRCTACKKGEIVESVVRVNPYPRSMQIIGPGWKSQTELHRSLYCSSCGVTYQFLPKAAAKTRKKP